MMESEFQMSMMGELTFFLGIQMKQIKQGTFMHQVKYTKDIMKKFNMAELKPVSTPMSSCTSQRHDRTFSSLWDCARAFSLPHALHIGRQFSESSGVSNTLLSLGFGILLLLHWILLGFSMLILRVVGLTERALLELAIFLYLLSFTGLLKNSL
jgi:hypothetical protein